MYVTPAVRSMQDDPIEGEPVRLLVEVESEELLDDVASAINATEAKVVDERRFGTLVVDTPQEEIEAVLDVDHISVVETANAVTIDADGAGEDIEFEP